MKRIIYLSILVLLLCNSIRPVESRVKANLFFGSYWPSFSRINETFYGLDLSGGQILGYSLGYEIIPGCDIRIQMGFSECKSHCPHPEVDIRLKTTIVSVLGVLDLFQYPKYKVYAGMGLTDYRINSPLYAKHDFGSPWGTVILLGAATPLHKSCQLKAEGQYVAGADGELFGVPLDWDGFKFLLSFGINF